MIIFTGIVAELPSSLSNIFSSSGLGYENTKQKFVFRDIEPVNFPKSMTFNCVPQIGFWWLKSNLNLSHATKEPFCTTWSPNTLRQIFVAIKGKNNDGNDFAKVPLEKGAAAVAVAKAKALGDLSENAEYHEARKEQSIVEVDHGSPNQICALPCTQALSPSIMTCDNLKTCRKPNPSNFT